MWTKFESEREAIELHDKHFTQVAILPWGVQEDWSSSKGWQCKSSLQEEHSWASGNYKGSTRERSMLESQRWGWKCLEE